MSAPTYLIVSPGLRNGAGRRWERLRPELEELLPGVSLIDWTGLPSQFADIPRENRPARLARALAAAIVVPDKLRGRRWVGLTAAAEADAFAAAGKPVTVFADGALFPWAACALRSGDVGAPEFTPVEVIAPDD